MTILLENVLMTQGFVFLKSWNDSVYIKNRKVEPTHLLEWFMVAWFATTAGLANSQAPWIVLAFDCWQVPITWILMDIWLCFFLKHNPLTYVGSGEWDKFFKHNFPSHTARSMWIVKVALLFVTSWGFYEITK